MSVPANFTVTKSGDTESLGRRRREAAEMSQGSSGEPIYRAIEAKLAALGAGGELLDFGAGTGHLTSRLFHAGRFRRLTGADLYARPADLDAQIGWIQGDLNDQLPSPKEGFDTIVAAEVIEHLENPRAVSRELVRLLRPGGLLVLSTPNNESVRSLIALLVRGHFVSFGDTSYPAHISALTRVDLRRVLTESGFVNVEISYTDAGAIPGLPARTWQSMLGRLAQGVRFSDNVLVAARKPGRAA
jgi:2-polyprenyl-3-methyl-5-hydroxy-6-metoxy-1,4-benzoquinol methylase